AEQVCFPGDLFQQFQGDCFASMEHGIANFRVRAVAPQCIEEHPAAQPGPNEFRLAQGFEAHTGLGIGGQINDEVHQARITLQPGPRNPQRTDALCGITAAELVAQCCGVLCGCRPDRAGKECNCE